MPFRAADVTLVAEAFVGVEIRLASEPTLKPLNPPKKMVTIKDPVLFAILAFRDISNAGVQIAGTLRSFLRFFLGASATALPLITLTAWVLTPMWPAYAKDITLGAVQMTAETEWFRTIELGIRAAADKAGAKVLVGNARAQVDTEAQIVDNFVARGVDAIIISALNPTSSVPALKRAFDNGVKLVDYNTTIDSPIMTTFVGVDNTELGAQMGRYIADYVKDKMGGNAKIALITIPKYEAGRQRREGFVKEVTTVPGVSIVAEQEGEFPDPAANKVETILEGHPETQLIWAANEGGLVGAITAARSRRMRLASRRSGEARDEADGLLAQARNASTSTSPLPRSLTWTRMRQSALGRVGVRHNALDELVDLRQGGRCRHRVGRRPGLFTGSGR